MGYTSSLQNLQQKLMSSNYVALTIAAINDLKKKKIRSISVKIYTMTARNQGMLKVANLSSIIDLVAVNADQSNWVVTQPDIRSQNVHDYYFLFD